MLELLCLLEVLCLLELLCLLEVLWLLEVLCLLEVLYPLDVLCLLNCANWVFFQTFYMPVRKKMTCSVSATLSFRNGIVPLRDKNEL